MASSSSALAMQPQFAFASGSSAPALSLGSMSGQQQHFAGKKKGGKQLMVRTSSPLAASSSTSSATCSFTTAGSSSAARKLVGRKTLQRSRMAAAPFASMTLAAVTVSAPASAPPAAPKKKKSLSEIMSYASQKALSGGIPGMVAMAVQVLSLMWLRTTVNYQYRYGTSMLEALRTLYSQGGVPRFYNGLLPALLQGPLSRFGDTAANTGVLALLEDVDIPVQAKTVAASMGAALFRIALMPIDATKTIMQVEGASGLSKLANKVKVGGPTVLFHGALAASAATFVGHYPWFAVYNTLNETLPKYDELSKRLLRSAFIGFCSSFVSDCCSNSIRVVKTAKQTATTPMTYGQVIKMVVEKDGVVGLFGRGLGTKIITNGIQGIMFSVIWRLGQDYYAKREKEEAAKKKADEEAAAAAAAEASKKKK